MMWQTLILQFIYFGAGLCLLAGAVELAKRRKDEMPAPLFWTALALAPIQIRMGMLLDGSLPKYPLLGVFSVSGLFLMGPLVLNMARTMIDFTFGRLIRLWPHFIPAILLTGFDLWFVLLGAKEQARLMQDGLFGASINLVTIGVLAGIVHVAGYFIYLIVLNLKARANYDLKYSRMVWMLLTVPVLGLVIWFAAIFFAQKQLGMIGASAITMLCLSFFLFTARYPDFFINLRTEIERKRYESTPLNGIDVKGIREELEKMMQSEKVFLDETLRLAHVADELGISTHQLSRILNEQFGKNFNEYINGYRVKEAQNLLLGDLEKSILDVAYEVGFNSKTTFNQQFSKITGMTPKVFRKTREL